MSIIELTPDNVWEYSTYIGDDMAENLSRSFYRGLMALNDKREPLCGVIWRLIGIDRGDEVKSNIEWFRAEDNEAANEIFDSYKSNIDKDDVMESSFTIPAKINSLEKQVLKDQGFSVRLTEGDDIVVSLKELKQIPLLQNKAPMKSVNPIQRMTVRTFRRVIGRCVYAGKVGVCEDLEYLPMAYFDLDVSSYVQGEDEVTGIMLFHTKPSGIISVVLMAALNQDFAKTIPGMMRHFVVSCDEKFSEDTLIHFSRHNQPTFLLSEKLLPRGFGCPVYTGERKEK